jgi:DNA primase
MKINDDDLKEILLNPHLNRRGEYICTCPFCGKNEHFYVSKEKQLFDCKRCGENGNIYKLLNFLDKLYLLKDGVTVKRRDLLLSIEQFNEKNYEDTVVNELPAIKMPAGWKVFANNDYLENRGVTTLEMKRYNIGGTNLFKKFNNYILMPVIENKKVRGFVGRYGAKKVPKELKRYKNNDGFSSSELLYGIDEVIEGKTKTVILVEGIFDKISVDRFLNLWEDDEIKCLCTFGKKISDVQIKKIYNKKVQNVVLLYDFDAVREIKKYGIELERYFFTSITFTNKKDIDECTEDEALEVFNSLMKPKEFNLNIIGKIKS